MDRRDELKKVFNNVSEDKKTILYPMIDDVVFLEERLTELKKLPFIQVNASNPSLQKPTIAGKQYKELLQQYNNCIKILCSVLHKDEGNHESPLRLYLKRLEND